MVISGEPGRDTCCARRARTNAIRSIRRIYWDFLGLEFASFDFQLELPDEAKETCEAPCLDFLFSDRALFSLNVASVATSRSEKEIKARGFAPPTVSLASSGSSSWKSKLAKLQSEEIQ